MTNKLAGWIYSYRSTRYPYTITFLMSRLKRKVTFCVARIACTEHETPTTIRNLFYTRYTGSNMKGRLRFTVNNNFGSRYTEF